jgi:hypothetical protein
MNASLRGTKQSLFKFEIAAESENFLRNDRTKKDKTKSPLERPNKKIKKQL